MVATPYKLIDVVKENILILKPVLLLDLYGDRPKENWVSFPLSVTFLIISQPFVTHKLKDENIQQKTLKKWTRHLMKFNL